MTCRCGGVAAGSGTARAPLQRAGKGVAWALPSATLLLMPKCPVCLAAYVALWTGVGLSLHAAAYLRWTLLALSTLTLLSLAVKHLGPLRGAFHRLTKENERCSTKS